MIEYKRGDLFLDNNRIYKVKYNTGVTYIISEHYHAGLRSDITKVQLFKDNKLNRLIYKDRIIKVIEDEIVVDFNF